MHHIHPSYTHKEALKHSFITTIDTHQGLGLVSLLTCAQEKKE